MRQDGTHRVEPSSPEVAWARLEAERLRERVEELRRIVVRLRASRRTLLVLLEQEQRRRAALEEECARMRRRILRLRAGRRRGSASALRRRIP